MLFPHKQEDKHGKEKRYRSQKMGNSDRCICRVAGCPDHRVNDRIPICNDHQRGTERITMRSSKVILMKIRNIFKSDFRFMRGAGCYEEELCATVES